MKLYNISVCYSSKTSSCVKDLTMATYTLDNIKKAIKNALEKRKDLNDKYVKVEVIESTSQDVIFKFEFTSNFDFSLADLLND